MTERMTKVRVSVREKVEPEDSTWRTTEPYFQHKRYQILKSLVPMSGNRIFELGQSGYEADWEAIARAKPVIQDGWRLVTFSDGEPDLFFDVEKRLKRGRKQHLLLRASPYVQS